MSVYLTSWSVWVYLSAAWVDITSYVLHRDNIGLKWGINGNGPLDILASTGTMTLTLNNAGWKFSAGRAELMSGFKVGVPIKLVQTFGTTDYVKRFYIDKIKPTTGLYGQRSVRITAVDWLDRAAKYPLFGLGVGYDQTADQALDTIIAAMPADLRPLATSFDTGQVVFPATFDMTTNKTVAYSEFAKIARSEMGFIYLRHDGTDGETLVFENMYHRNASGTASLSISDTMVDADINDGDVINQVTVTAYPKKIDLIGGGVKVLYDLATPMLVGSNQSVVFSSNYTDPSGAGRRCNADPDTMVDPVATTDFLCNTKADGTGTNITADCTVTAVYTASGVTFTVTNNSTLNGYITFLQARGLGIYTYNPIESIATSSVSYNEFGYQPETINQPYQRDLVYGQLINQSILDANKQPHTRINKLTFCANESSAMMTAALSLDVGDLVEVVESQTGLSGYYYIQNVSLTVIGGNIIMCTWVLKLSLTLFMGLSLIGAEFNAASTDMIGFGYLPELINKNERTVEAWIFIHSAGVTEDVQIIAGAFYGVSSTGGGWFLYMSGDSLGFYQEAPTTSGAWFSSVGALPYDEWVHVAVTRDCTTATTLPKMYINGVEDTGVTEALRPGGAINDETGAQFAIGNMDTAAHPKTYPFDGVIEDVRYYGRILSAAEIAAEYADVTENTTGLLFQGPAVRTADLTYFTDHVMVADDRVIDNIYGVVGSASDTVTTRIAAQPNLP